VATSGPSLTGVAAVVLPGGFAYGDYLAGRGHCAVQSVMRSVAAFADEGGPRPGGFLQRFPGACRGRDRTRGVALRNRSLRFLGRDVTNQSRTSRYALHARDRRAAAAAHSRSPTVRAATTPTDATLDALERDGRSSSATCRQTARGRERSDGRPTETARSGRSRVWLNAAERLWAEPHPDGRASGSSARRTARDSALPGRERRCAVEWRRPAGSRSGRRD
jgi:hypothetical protein